MFRILLAVASCTATISELDDCLHCSTPDVSLLQVNLELGQRKLEHAAPREHRWPDSGETYRQQLRNSADTHYLAEITVGNQTIKGILDTGSFDLVVTSNRCWMCVAVTSSYNPDTSPTFIAGDGAVHTSAYGSGALIDTLAYDDVQIGDGLFVAEKQPFYMVIGHMMPIMLGADFAAVIGMGRTGVSQQINNSTEAALPESFHPITRQFSHCLGREPGSPGWWIWHDPIPANAVSLDMKALYFWATDMNQTRMSNGIDLGCGSGCAVIFDSGTSLITAPASVVNAIDAELERLDADCTNYDILPDLEFSLDGKDFRLPPESYIGFVYGEIDPSLAALMTPPTMKCRALLMKLDIDSQFGPGWILGMPFFKEYYTTFASNATRDGGDKVFTTPAGDDCYPSSGTALTEVGRTSSKAEEAMPRRRAKSQLRRIAAHTIRAPPWMIKAAAKGGKTRMTL